MRKELVCSECGKELRECTPPKKSNKTPLIAGVIAAIAIAGGIIGYTCMGGSAEPTPLPVPDTTKVDTVANTVPEESETTKDEPTTSESSVKEKKAPETATSLAPKTEKKSGGSANLGYAKFTGPVANGLPDGQGRMTFSSSHVIDSRDPKGRIAEAGDYVIGEWKSGKLIQGRWYGSDGNVKGSIIIGM